MIYNDAYSSFAGGRHPALLGSNVREGWPEVAAFNDHVMRAVLGGGTLSYEDQRLTLHRHGRPESVWMNLYYSPVIGEDGRPAGLMAIVVETTRAVLARRELQAEREQLRQLFEQAPTFMALLQGPQHRIALANPGYLRLIERDNVVGRTIAEVVPGAAAQGYIARLDEVYRTGKALSETSALYTVDSVAGKPAQHRWIDFVLQPLKDEKGNVTGIFVEGADVTARAESEAAMWATQARLRELNANLEQRVLERSFTRGQVWRLSPDLLGAVDRQGHLQTANPAWTQVFGYSEEELSGLSIFSLVHPEDLESSHVAFDAITAATPALRFPNRCRRKDGSYRWISWVAVVDDGVIYCMGRDITVEQIAAQELEAAQAALRQSQKMEALGQLTGGVAHDFNNLLAGISGSLELLQARLAPLGVQGVQPLIEVAQRSAQRAASLTQRLLAFSRQQRLDPRPTMVDRLVQGLEDLIRRTVGPQIHVEVVCADESWLTLVDAAQLESAVLNLAINARDAMSQGGRLRLETVNEDLDDDQARSVGVPPGEYIAFRVIDDGCGMSREILNRACDPFFTTKPLGQGTGLGLSMIQGFMHQSGGQMHLQSEVGIGTTVCLLFPRFPGEADEAVAPAASKARPVTSGESILVIDDEPGVREVIAYVLRDEGYEVIEADDGLSGLNVLRSDATIDLLITDIGLPGELDGLQVAEAARELRPDLKVLFATGYAEQLHAGNGTGVPGTEVMTKPFRIETLIERVRTLLDG